MLADKEDDRTIYSILNCDNFFVMDFIIRKDVKATSIRKTKDDNNSTKFIVLAFFITLTSAELLNYYKVGKLDNPTIAKIALVFMFLGLIIRIYSMLKLKNSYTRTLLTTEQQKLISTGLYKIIRHPGYLGTILIWAFFGFAIKNYIVAIIGISLTFIAYSYRIKNEEKMLLHQFGQQYKDYQKRTWKIVPHIW